jgi:signal transduction histidine kinase
MIGLIQVIGTTLAGRGELNWLAYALLLAGPVALAARRRHPVATLMGTIAATLTYALAGFPGGPYFLALLVAIFVAVRAGHRPVTWVLCGLAYWIFVLAGRLWPEVAGVELAYPSLAQAVVVLAWLAVVLALAEGSRIRAQSFAELSRARAEAARARAEQSRRQASEERLRIARELHDVLGHHLSLINVRAGVALHLLDTKPDPAEQAREALAAIKEASAEALREVRAVLATLRPEDESAPRTPAPGLAELDGLIAETRTAGLGVTVRLEGRPRPLPPEVERAAYRIAQEALTNVRRHAGPSADATVTVEYAEGALLLRVDNDGTAGPSTVDGGTGIPGMRERTTALGGRLTAAALTGGGFRVEAVLPTEGGGE